MFMIDSGERLADLPVVAIGVDGAADAPSVGIVDGVDLQGTGLDRGLEHGVRTVNGENDPDGRPAKASGGEIEVHGVFAANQNSAPFTARRAITSPASRRKISVAPKAFFVELNGLGAVAHIQPWRDGRRHWFTSSIISISNLQEPVSPLFQRTKQARFGTTAS